MGVPGVPTLQAAVPVRGPQQGWAIEMGFQFEVDQESVRAFQDALRQWQEQTEESLMQWFQELAQLAETKGKAEAPWRDRTGNARRGLYGYAWKEGNKIYVSFNHSVYYGVFLELLNNGRYAILQPVMEYIQDVFYDNVNSVLVLALKDVKTGGRSVAKVRVKGR